MQLSFSLHLALDGQELDAPLIDLLDALSTHGSVAAAARSTGVSYRFAWDKLRSAQVRYGQALVRMERGRGAHLTDFAVRLFEAQARARADTARALAHIANDFERGMPASARRPAPRLTLAASHDLALITLKEYCARADPPLDLDLHFRGSVDALDEWSRGRCDFAGFHTDPTTAPDPAVRRRLSPRTHQLVILGDRTQGLMLAGGNPKRVAGIADLAKRGVRFVNRQPGSGTRILFDRLLAAANRRAEEIRGYETEEFTHLAVAATVASGHADAGFGIQAAAARYGLSFLPLSQETYFLAARRADLRRAAARTLLEHMRSPELRRRLARLKGYHLESCGTSIAVDAAIGNPHS